MSQSPYDTQVLKAAESEFCDGDSLRGAIALGASPNASINGRSALILALERGNRGAVSILLNAGADPLALDEFKRSCAWHGAFCGDSAALEAVLAAGCPPEGHGLQEPIFGAMAGSPDCIRAIEILLDAGAFPNPYDNTEGTALCMAGRNGLDDVGILLLDRGAGMAPGTEGESPFFSALAGGALELAREMVSRGMLDPTEETDRRLGGAAIWAASSGKASSMDLVESFGCDLFSENSDGEWAGSAAVRKGSVETLQWLSDRGLPVDKQGTAKPAITIAASMGHLDCVKWLLSNGADPNARNESGNSALHFAARKRRADIVALLFSFGATHLKNKADLFPEHLAVGNEALFLRTHREESELSLSTSHPTARQTPKAL